MKSDIEKLLAVPGLEATAFDESSRYYGLPTREHVDAKGVRRTYVQRRLIPPPEAYATLDTHTVVEGDRLDNIAFKYLGNSLFYWRICDANVALSPVELTRTVNRKLRVTLAAGIPGEDSV